MKISTKGRYAIEALTYMASLGDNEPVKIKNIADNTNISIRYLEQIFFILRKENILASKRGTNGGYLFLADIKNLTAGKIIKSVEGNIVPVVCVKDINNCKSKARENCLTRNLWMDISSAIDDVLENITLFELKEYYVQKEGEAK